MMTGAIFSAMHRTGPIALIVRALLFALVGFVVAPGVALAHGGAHTADSGRINVRVLAAPEQHAHDGQSTKASTSQRMSERADASNAPRPGNQRGGHLASGCCNVACHAALAAPFAEPTGVGDRREQCIAGLSDTLVGRPNDRAERPPRHG
jgi:hypothetical protein